MSKIMIVPQRDALASVLRTAGKTQEEVAAATATSRRTLQKINKGQAVKDDTLRKLAVHLHVPVEYFLNTLSDSGTTAGLNDNALPDSQVQGRSSSCMTDLLMKPIATSSMASMFLFTDAINWHVNAQTVAPKAIAIIRELGAAIEKLHELVNDPFNPKHRIGSLEAALLPVEAVANIETKLARLAELKLHIMGNISIVWSKEEEHYDGSFVGYSFTSKAVVQISIENIGVKSKRIKIHTGGRPPKYGGADLLIRVNGKLLDPDTKAKNDGIGES